MCPYYMLFELKRNGTCLVLKQVIFRILKASIIKHLNKLEIMFMKHFAPNHTLFHKVATLGLRSHIGVVDKLFTLTRGHPASLVCRMIL